MSAAKVYLNQKIRLQAVVFFSPLSSSLLPCPDPYHLPKFHSLLSLSCCQKKGKQRLHSSPSFFSIRSDFEALGLTHVYMRWKPLSFFFSPSLKTWCCFGFVVKRSWMSSCIPNSKHFLFYFLFLLHLVFASILQKYTAYWARLIASLKPVFFSYVLKCSCWLLFSDVFLDCYGTMLSSRNIIVWIFLIYCQNTSQGAPQL